MSEPFEKDSMLFRITPNPLSKRVLLGHIKAVRHQQAWDVALVLAWKHAPTWRVGQLVFELQSADLSIDGLDRTPPIFMLFAKTGKTIPVCKGQAFSQ